MRNYNIDNNSHPIYVHTQYEEGQVVCRSGNCGGGGNPFFLVILFVFGMAFYGHVMEGNVKSVKPVHTQQQVTK